MLKAGGYLMALLAPALSFGSTMVVPPGDGTLQAAIDAAAPGTTLRLQAGCYRGPVVIDKERIRIVAPEFSATIDGDCAPVALEVAADKVRIKAKREGLTGSSLSVINGLESVVAVGGHDAVRIDGLRMGREWDEVCQTGCSTFPSTGLTVTGGTNTRIKNVVVPGLALGEIDTGIHVRDVAAGARLWIDKVRTFTDTTGLLIENSGGGTLLGGSRIRVFASHFQLDECEPGSDISLVNSSGILVKRAFFAEGRIAIQFDATSESNHVKGSTGYAFCGSGLAVIDEGAGNCGSKNTFPMTPCS